MRALGQKAGADNKAVLGAQRRKAPGARSERGAESRASKKKGRKKAAGDSPKAAKPANLPDFIPPSLATQRDAAPSGAAWLHEIKFDGYRIEARLDHGKITLLTRNRQDWTHRFKPIAAAVAKLAAETALLDGELVVEDRKGLSSFSLLQTDLKAGRSDRFVYNVFDLLHLDGRDLTALPLVERKAALQRLLPANAGPIRYVEHFDGDGRVIFENAAQAQFRRHRLQAARRAVPFRPHRQFRQDQSS